MTDRRFWRAYSEFPTLCGCGMWTSHHVCGHCKYWNKDKYLNPENDEKRTKKQNTLENKSLVVKEKCLMRQHEASILLVFSRQDAFPINAYIYELIYCHLVGINFIIEQYIP